MLLYIFVQVVCAWPHDAFIFLYAICTLTMMKIYLTQLLLKQTLTVL